MAVDESFDCVLIGTGVTESLVAASLSRAGKRVLHLDDWDVYGSEYAALNLRALLTFLNSVDDTKGSKPTVSHSFSNVDIQIHVPQRVSEAAREDEEAFHQQVVEYLQRHPDLVNVAAKSLSNESTETSAIHAYLTGTSNEASTVTLNKISVLFELLQQHRQWSLELTPKVFLARGDMVELLISSGASRYVEFKALEGVYMCSPNGIDRVPGSKEDVFADNSVSLIEKRRLMRFMTSALTFQDHPDETIDYETQPFDQFLEAQQIGARMREVIIHALAMSDRSDISTAQGLELSNRQVQSLGRFGRTAYLCALYGAGAELSQGFCRMSAVYGGTYMLNYALESITRTSESKWKVTGVDGTTFSSPCLVASASHAALVKDSTAESENISRLMLILDGSVHTDANLTISVFPPTREYAIYGIQHSFDTNSCPLGKNVLYLMTRAYDGAKDELMAAASKLANLHEAGESTKPNCLLSIFYNQRRIVAPTPSLLDSAMYCSTPGAGLDLDDCVEEAKRIFTIVCGEEAVFMPALASEESVE
ncbi:hypothetical protein SmJEL517_g06229 [Synchytrium microbalum]|uniref:Rab proteins geranylgeranyltransferase component n=1 Tax=Synchytrium microbalum TaxID=1806994 RepID=A0A507BSL9_9FUNG|nr:uncharacterized protein SmJEL517_g06229 [Synchytrium microbalum]TPX30139.1 hypothetical protein SmJEL517_g06229 [Synchytrium microbalum]